jgi:hypothetical protein
MIGCASDGPKIQCPPLHCVEGAVISRQTIERVSSVVADYSDETLEREFEELFGNHSEVCQFVMDLTAESRQQVQELVLFLTYMTYKAVVEEGGHFEPITPEAITEAYRESEVWMENMSRIEESEIESVSFTDVGEEPHLLGFVVSEINEAIEDRMQPSEEEKGTMFLVMKTVITAMTRRSEQ